MTTGDNSEHAVLLGDLDPAIAGLTEGDTWAEELPTDLEEGPLSSVAPLPLEPSTDPLFTSLVAPPFVIPTPLELTSTSAAP